MNTTINKTFEKSGESNGFVSGKFERIGPRSRRSIGHFAAPPD